MNRTQHRTAAKRMKALARSRRANTVEQFYNREPDLPGPKAVNNYFIKVGTGWFRISCTGRPDEGLRAKLAQRKDVIEADEKRREKATERRAYHADAGDRRRAAEAKAQTAEEETPRNPRMRLSAPITAILAMALNAPSSLFEAGTIKKRRIC